MNGKRVLALGLGCLLCLGGCAPAEEPPSPPALVPALAGLIPEGELAGSVCEPEATASDEKTRILQTVGDEMTLHLVVEVTFAGEIDPEAIPMVTADLYEGVPEEGEEPTQLLPVKVTPRRVETVEATGENSALYRLVLHNPEKALGGEKTLVLSGFQLDGEPVEEPDHFVSWVVENTAPILEAEVKDKEGEKKGSVLLSPFGMRLDTDIQAGDEETVQLLMKDGTTAPPVGAMGGGHGGNHMGCSFLFSQAQSLDQIAGVLVGEYKAEIKG